MDYTGSIFGYAIDQTKNTKVSIQLKQTKKLQSTLNQTTPHAKLIEEEREMKKGYLEEQYYKHHIDK